MTSTTTLHPATYVLLLGLVAIAAIASVVTAAPAWATFPGTNGRIAFASTPPTTAAATQGVGNRDIYASNPDGSGLINLTEALAEPRFALEPDWSPDGTKVAVRAGPTNAAEIYTVNADGTALTQLTSNSFKDYTPAWSPDGSMIAFASNSNDPSLCPALFGNCNIDIFVMPATGGFPVQVTFGSGLDQFPQFSPDGNSIAYVSNVSGANAVYRVDLVTLATTKLTPDSLQAGPPDYSPDGGKIVSESNFKACKTGASGCRTDILVMNADGSSITQLTEKSGNNYDPTWSPQGDKLVFTHSNGANFHPQQIYVMNADGTGRKQITANGTDSFGPDWGSG